MNDILTTTSRRVLNGDETWRLGVLIDAHCKRLTADTCAYEEGWSDKRVAAEFGCTIHNVAGQRTQMMGKLVDLPPVAKDPRFDLLARNFNLLIERLADHGAIVDDLLDLKIE